MSEEDALFRAVDALLEEVAQDPLPDPAERRRLREAAGLSQAQIAKALETRREAVGNWEAGRSEPRPPKRAAYARLLERLAARFPAGPPPAALPEAAPAPETFAGPAPAAQAAGAEPAAEAAAAADTARTPAPAPAAARRAAQQAQRRPSSRRPGAKKTARRSHNEFPGGPLVVLDVAEGGELTAYGVGGVLLDCEARTIPALAEWTLGEAGLGAPPLTGEYGKPTDPLVVLTAAAAEYFGLPSVLEDRRGLRLAEDHPVVKQTTG
ncbi:helix-turn-helix transcriptional regulator, partial [Streptomyces sp. NPDC047117]|uniref:helix-turn-helix transcriptional regulator n=1 Tax=Streptomyces sp. NPDC047117 TaxID=3155379 RepID=UPI0033DFD4C5